MLKIIKKSLRTIHFKSKDIQNKTSLFDLKINKTYSISVGLCPKFRITVASLK